MANTDKNIVITPNTGSSTDDPKVVFSGADASTAAQDITLYAYPDNSGTLSFEGSSGQLFSITNDLTGVIFSVNDISGIPSLEVNADGTVSIAEFDGDVGIGTSSPSAQLHVIADSATTNADIPVLRITATSTGTPLAGIGPSIEFESETAAGSPGNLEIGGVIALEATDVTSTSEDFDLVFSTMAAGAAAAERMRITSTGNVTATSFNGVALTTGGAATNFLNETGAYSAPPAGTVTSVSVVSANGFAGSVATSTTTPAITISTSINSPILAGNGTAITAATTTGTGSTAVLSAAPTLTGATNFGTLVGASNSVATVTDILLTDNGNIGATQGMNFIIDTDNTQTGQTFVWGHNAPGTSGLGTIMTLNENGNLVGTGTLTGFTSYAGILEAQLLGSATTHTLTNKTFDANGTGNSLSNVDVADLANGTDGELITWSAAGAPTTVATGTATHVLTSNGPGTAPTFQAAPGGGTVSGTGTDNFIAVWNGTGDIDAVGSFNITNALDKTADETITGIYTIQDTLAAGINYSLIVNGDDAGTTGEASGIFLGAINNTLRGTYIGAEVLSASNNHAFVIGTSAASATPVERVRITDTAFTASTLDADFDAITATSYGGITEANLVDKTATETITGSWKFDIDTIGDIQFDRQSTTGASGVLFSNDDGAKGYVGYGDDEAFKLWDSAAAVMFQVTNTSSILLEEKTNADADQTARGQIWVKDDAPNNLYFTDDAGNDYALTGPESSQATTATVQTTTATQTEILAYAVASGTSVGFEALIMGRQDATGDTVLEKIRGIISNEAGTTALIDTPGVDRHESAGATTWAVTVAADDTADTLTFDVTGEAAHTIDWKIKMDVVVI